MSVLDILDATRLCSRWSPDADDPTVWARPAHLVRAAPAPVSVVSHSWRATVRNPQAVLLTGLVGAGLVLDAGQRLVAAALRP